MANPWDQDEIVAPPSAGAAPTAQTMPWDSDPIIYDGKEYPADYGMAPAAGDGDLGGGPLEIDIVGGTPMGEAQMRAPLPVQVGDQAQSLFRADSDFRDKSGVGIGAMMGAAAKDMFGSRKGVAEYLAKQSGGRVVRTSDGDYGLILPDGSEYRINDEGLDNIDIANVAGNIAASFLPAAWAGRAAQARNAGLLGRAGLQGATAGALDATGQLAVDRANFDPMRVAASAAGGAGGEAVGTGLATLAGKAGQLSRATSGANREAARNLLADAGVSAPPSRLEALAPQMEQIKNGADPRAVLGENLYGFQYTQGQRLTDPARKFEQLSREEVLRQSPGGNTAFAAANRNNTDRLGEALAGMSDRLGARAAATPGEMVQGAASRLQSQAATLRGQVDDAYAGVRNADTVAINRDSVASVPDRLRAAVSDFDINPATTPGAARALDQVRAATGDILSSGNVRGVTLRAAETQRRILNNAIDGAANRADRAALTSIKREFDNWLDEAVDTALVSGDPAALAQLKKARGLRAEFFRRFEGGKDSDKFIAGLLDGSRTPEELLNVALGASQVSKSGGARFIQRLRVAADNDPEVMGGLRAAHFARLTMGRNGEPLDMGRIINNIKATEYNNASVAKALYNQKEWVEIKALANALEPLVAKGDFAKSSGTTERLARMLFQRVGGNLPLVGGTIQAIGGVRDAVRAQRAVGGRLTPRYEAATIIPAAGSAAVEEGARD